MEMWDNDYEHRQEV
jgi:hypothetical protein